MPPALARRPQLTFLQTYCFNAYQYVAGSRQAGMGGALPVPLNQIQSYFELFYIRDAELRELLLERIQFLDGVQLKHLADQQPKKPP